MLQDHIPTKQGLRLHIFGICSISIRLQDHIPTKQGLRLCGFALFALCFLCLKDHIPTKQGLRLLCNLDTGTLGDGAKRPHPNKTRIKTKLYECKVPQAKPKRPHPNKTRIKTTSGRKRIVFYFRYKTISQQNKDEEMSYGHFDSEAQRERRTEHFRLLIQLKLL